jgi:hypothetical protein
MAYMSYCRFEGVAGDLCECVSDLQDGKPLSESESIYAKNIYELAKEYIEAYESYEPIKEDEEEDEL